jgi:hypothetical protein
MRLFRGRHDLLVEGRDGIRNRRYFIQMIIIVATGRVGDGPILEAAISPTDRLINC